MGKNPFVSPRTRYFFTPLHPIILVKICLSFCDVEVSKVLFKSWLNASAKERRFFIFVSTTWPFSSGVSSISFIFSFCCCFTVLWYVFLYFSKLRRRFSLVFSVYLLFSKQMLDIYALSFCLASFDLCQLFSPPHLHFEE